MRAWLRDEGAIPEERLAALRAPAGLNLGAETAEEIARLYPGRTRAGPARDGAFVAAPGPATLAGGASQSSIEPIVDDIVLLDPVCGMTVDRAHARHLAEHEGVVYAFCSMGCRTSFMREPTAYLPSSVSSAD